MVKKKLNGQEGSVNLLEFGLITAIVLMAAVYFFLGGSWMKIRMNHGNDSLAVNTADSVARINSNNGLNCVVDGCGSSGHCPHWSSIGYIGYFDNVANKIVGEKPKGYNEYSTMEIDRNQFHGDPGTMVIKVIAKEGEMVLSWELGRQ
ncbi:MAG: hypothetical protein IJ225_05680 [Solobacterium sp.]|nr:hypothetical protein [Solobacterium sp.]